MSRASDTRAAQRDQLAEAAVEAVDALTGGPDTDRPPAVPAVDARTRLQRKLQGTCAAETALEVGLSRDRLVTVESGSWAGIDAVLLREEQAVVDFLQTWQRRKSLAEADSRLSARLARENLAAGHELLQEVRDDV